HAGRRMPVARSRRLAAYGTLVESIVTIAVAPSGNPTRSIANSPPKQPSMQDPEGTPAPPKWAFRANVPSGGNLSGKKPLVSSSVSSSGPVSEVNVKFKSLITNPVRFWKLQVNAVSSGNSVSGPDVQLGSPGPIGNVPKSNVNGS